MAKGRRACPLGALLAFVVAGVAPAAADLGGRAILAWRSYEADDLRTHGFHQLYDLRLDKAFTDRFEIRVTFRGEDDASGSTFFDERRTADHRELQPGARLLYKLETLQLQADWDRLTLESGDDQNAVSGERTLDRLQARLSFHPESLPGLTADASRHRVDDAGNGVELTETRGALRLDYSWRGLQLSAAHQARELDDVGGGFSRENRDLLGSIGYSAAFWGDRLAVQAQVSSVESRIDQRSTGGGVARVPNPVAIAAALETIDDTPTDDRDHALVVNPLLTDGDLTRAAGVPFGPEAPANLNLAVDLGRFAQVDELRVVARDPAGNPVATGGTVVWDLYASDDRLFWRPVVQGVTSRYDAAQGFWSIAFPQATVRYLKLVSFFVNTVPTELTELLAFHTTELAPGTAVGTELSASSGSGGLTVKLHRTLTLGWSGLFNDSTQTADLRPELSTTDRDQRVTTLWQPKPWGGLELQRQWRTTRTTDGLDERRQKYESSTAILRLTPARRLVTSLEYAQTDELVDLRRSATERLFVRTTAHFWNTVQVTLDVGRQERSFELEGWSIASPSLTAAVNGRLTRTLQWTATATLQENRVRGAVPGELELAARDTRWWSELFWRPSGQLGLGTRVGRVTRGDESGVIQGYIVQWQPFPGGAIRLNGTYDQDLDPVNDRASRRLIVSPSWSINRHLTLTLSYSLLTTTQGDVASDTESVLVALTASP